VANELLIRYSFYPQDHIEANIGPGETTIPNKRFKSFYATLSFLENFFCHHASNFFHMIQITFITDSLKSLLQQGIRDFCFCCDYLSSLENTNRSMMMPNAKLVKKITKCVLKPPFVILIPISLKNSSIVSSHNTEKFILHNQYMVSLATPFFPAIVH